MPTPDIYTFYYIKYITDVLRLVDDTSRGIPFFYHIDQSINNDIDRPSVYLLKLGNALPKTNVLY